MSTKGSRESRIDASLETRSTDGRIVRVSFGDVYFAFADGRLDYDCYSCGGQCCKGHGYKLATTSELQAHRGFAPAISLFVDPEPGTNGEVYSVHNCEPGCFFLTDNGLCGIHANHGAEAKPEICRLFPFNLIIRSHNHLLVAPHVGLCPLQVLPAGARSDLSGHLPLLKLMQATGLRLPVLELDPICSNTPDILQTETELRDQSEKFLENTGYHEFAQEQLSPKYHHGRCLRQESIAEYLSDICAVLGTTPSMTSLYDQEIARILTAVTPALRAHLMFPAWRTHAAPVCFDRIPYLLVALHTMLCIARDSGMRRITYQTVLKMFSGNIALLALLAYCGTTVVWRPRGRIQWRLDRSISAMQTTYLHAIKALLRPSHIGTNLSSLLKKGPTDDPVRRIAFLKTIGRLLVGDIYLKSNDRYSVVRRPRLGTRIQHLTLRVLRDDVLLSLAGRA